MSKRAQKKSNEIFKFLIGLTMFTLAIRLYFFNYITTGEFLDHYRLAHLANGILHGSYEIGGEFWIITQPLYPFLMAISNLAVGDMLLSGRLASLIFGVCAVPLTYIMWREIESKEVGLLAALLLSVNYVMISASINVFVDTLYLSIFVLSIILLFRSKDNFKLLPVLGLALGLASLTRGEGYILTLCCIASLIYWNQKLWKEKNISEQDWFYVKIAILVYAILAFPWLIYSRLKAGEIYPSQLSFETRVLGHLGLRWIPAVSRSVTSPVLIISLVGALLSYKDRMKYFPLYVYTLLFSLSHMYFPADYERYTLSLMPIIFGWFSLGMFKITHRIFSKKLRYVIFASVFGLAFFYGMTLTENLMTYGTDYPATGINRYEAIKDSMIWFNSNSEEDARILVSDVIVYEYYTENNVTDIVAVMAYLDSLSTVEKEYLGNEIANIRASYNDILLRDNVPYLLPYVDFFMHENVHYFVMHDSTLPLPNERNMRVLALHSVTLNFSYKGKEVTFTPLKRFEKNNQAVYLYKIDWR